MKIHVNKWSEILYICARHSDIEILFTFVKSKPRICWPANQLD